MFEWDARKAAVNRSKHGVSFEEAATVFGDPDALDGPDLSHSDKESRFLRLGRAMRGASSSSLIRSGGETMAKASASSARGVRAAKSARRTRRRRRINFSEIQEASRAQLQAMRRVGRPPLGSEPRRLIAIRIDPKVLDAVRREAKQRRLGYQSLINDLLAKHVERARSAS